MRFYGTALTLLTAGLILINDRDRVQGKAASRGAPKPSPYKSTTKYKDDFNHDKFYAWCREKRKEGHTIFVSEYWMPEDFKCVWQKEVNSSLTKDTGSKKAVEKLFTLA